MLSTFIQITFMISLLLLGVGISKLDLTKPLTKENLQEYNSSLSAKESGLLITGAVLFIFSVAVGAPIVISLN